MDIPERLWTLHFFIVFSYIVMHFIHFLCFLFSPAQNVPEKLSLCFAFGDFSIVPCGFFVCSGTEDVPQKLRFFLFSCCVL